MTLKLMAGILSADDEKEAEQGIKIFWDAILCNPDGVLELGVEDKVSLIMHLLGQAKLDNRIPNIGIAVDLIDSVVLQDLARWGTQLKQSDYVSEKIKQGLLEYFMKDNKEWISETSCRLQEKFLANKKQVKQVHNVSIEVVVEIIESIINKFGQDERDKIAKKLIELIKQHNETKWQFTKKALETLLTMHQKTKLNNFGEKELLDALLLTAYDANLTELSLKGMHEILNIKANPSLMEKIKTNIKGGQGENLKAEDVIRTKVKLFNMIDDGKDPQVQKDVIDSVAPYLQNSIRDVRILASREVTEIAKGSGDKQLILDSISLLLSLVKDPEVQGEIAGNILTLMDLAGKDPTQKVVRDYVKSLMERMKDPTVENPAKILLMSEINTIIKINNGNVDGGLALDFLKELINGLQMAMKDPMSNQIKELAKICQGNFPLAKSFIKTLASVFKNEQYDFGFLAQQAVFSILSMIDKNDPQFIKDIANMLAPFLENYDTRATSRASDTLVEIAKKGNGKQVIDIFAPYLATPTYTTGIVSKAIVDVAKADIQQLAKDVISRMIPLLKHSDNNIKKMASSNIQLLMEHYKNTDAQWTKDLIMKAFIPLLKDSDSNVKETFVSSVASIMFFHQMDEDPQFVKSVLNSFTPLLQEDSPAQLKNAVSSGFNTIFQNSKTKETQLLIRDAIKALSSILKDSASNVRKIAACTIISLVKKDDSQDTQSKKDIFNSLVPIFQGDYENYVGYNVIKEISEGVLGSDVELWKHEMNLLALSLKDPNSSAGRSLLQIAAALPVLTKDALNLLTPNLEDSEAQIRCHSASYIIKLAKINPQDEEMMKEILQILFAYLTP